MLQRALFPLAPGKLTVTAMEAQVVASRTSSGARSTPGASSPSRWPSRRSPLPRKDEQGSPARSVSRRATSGASRSTSAVDRAAVAVGDAVTLTMTVRGTGNLRNVVLPALPTLPGWKGYEPKTNVALDPSAVVHGTKRSNG